MKDTQIGRVFPLPRGDTLPIYVSFEAGNCNSNPRFKRHTLYSPCPGGIPFLFMCLLKLEIAIAIPDSKDTQIGRVFPLPRGDTLPIYMSFEAGNCNSNIRFKWMKNRNKTGGQQFHYVPYQTGLFQRSGWNQVLCRIDFSGMSSDPEPVVSAQTAAARCYHA